MQCGPTWLFDDSPIDDPRGHGARAIEFLRDLRHHKSRAADRVFTLDPWQERIVRRIEGPRRADGSRQCRAVYLQVGRGNRKTSLGAALGLLNTFGPARVPFGQVITAASDRKQARIAFEEACGIISATAPLGAVARVQDFKNRITHPRSGAVWESISADAATQFGRTPVFALVDELWAHRRIDLWQAIRTGLAKVPGSLCVVTTTAGRGSNTPDFPIYEYAKKVAAGEIDDPSFLSIIFEAPVDCDWTDEAIWHATNPGLAFGYPDLEGLRQLAREAKERPADREAFCQFHLGIRQQHSVSPFVDMQVFDQCAAEFDDTALEAEPCWLGVDVSATTDLTAIVAVWRHDVGVYSSRAWFFVPADNLAVRAQRDGVPYPRWAAEGWITPTPGNVIDYRAVETKIRDLYGRFDVREIAFDKAYGAAVMNPLVDDGLPVVVLQQGWVTQAPAVKELERAIIGRTFRHDNNPVQRWCFENVAVHLDSAGNKTFHKGKSRDRIDGAAACWMAIARASSGDQPTISIFERPELWGEGNSAADVETAADQVHSDDAGESWDPAIITDVRNPKFAEHKRRFEAWQALQPDDF